MRIFGTILPFIGWRDYIVEPEKFFNNDNTGFTDEAIESIQSVIDSMGRQPDYLRIYTFEGEWFGYVIGKVINFKLGFNE